MNATKIFTDQRISRPRRSSHLVSAEPFSRNAFGGDDARAHAAEAGPLPAPPPSASDPAGLARALNDLLTRYVALLDTSWHGGWDQSDDSAIRGARTVLTQAGFAAMFPDEIARHLDLALPGVGGSSGDDTLPA